MESLLAAAARALAVGDALGALQRVALREDPPALALRGIAMAQLGELARARELLQRAARAFAGREPLARARCVVALAEVELALREFAGLAPRTLAAAQRTLHARGDHANALHARVLTARRDLLLGRLDAAAAVLEGLDTLALPPALAARAALVTAELSLRRLRTGPASAALERAQLAAVQSRVPGLLQELARARALLGQPAARRIVAGGEQSLTLSQVEALLSCDVLVVDACRRRVSSGDTMRSLARQPVLFALARALAAAWPGEVHRDALIVQTFRMREPDATHRARLRVEIGRLRSALRGLARVEATGSGFALTPVQARELALLVPPIEGEQAALSALLSDGAPWSTSALALALGTSQRTVQRALAELAAAGQVRAVGQARARRWLASPLLEIAPILLLPHARALA
ncbi:helix-turn-helix domain-containing protein [Ramlibacter sp. AN1015]|uniref:helix-turn-helix domain-containing protein n=1 Tax=Ramlibacter sp. AN1015 TaxID=3133428 RepID=UPI0030C2CB8E